MLRDQNSAKKMPDADQELSETERSFEDMFFEFEEQFNLYKLQNTHKPLDSRTLAFWHDVRRELLAERERLKRVKKAAGPQGFVAKEVQEPQTSNPCSSSSREGAKNLDFSSVEKPTGFHEVDFQGRPDADQELSEAERNFDAKFEKLEERFNAYTRLKMLICQHTSRIWKDYLYPGFIYSWRKIA